MIKTGRIISTTRRYVTVAEGDGKFFDAEVTPKFKDIAIGDQVEFSVDGEQIAITQLKERKNIFSRSYQGKTKYLSANVDRIYIVTAVPPLFNTIFIDRVLIAAYQADIPVTIIVNKTDLINDNSDTPWKTYQNLSIPLLFTSTKSPESLTEFNLSITSPINEVILLCGISGVGKSSLLNTLIPSALRKTSEVSKKTGQGKQTTSHAYGYEFIRKEISPLYIVDLPGIQNFGLSHLNKIDLARSFPEFQEFSPKCAFRDCIHIKERDCEILKALNGGQIAESRYISYLNIMDEIENNSPY